MNFLSLISKAETSIESIAPLVIGALMTALAFFLSGAFRRSDSNRDDIAKINQQLGLLNAAKDRAMEQDGRINKSLDDLNDEVHALRERVLLLEHKGSK